ncbi:MAG: hypothetical protein WDW36_006945 [Sanguina aurantia]
MKVDGGDYDDYGLAEPRDRRRAPSPYRQNDNNSNSGRGGRGYGRGGNSNSGNNWAGQRTTYAPVDTPRPRPPEESAPEDDSEEATERQQRRPVRTRAPPKAARVPLEERPEGIYDADEDEGPDDSVPYEEEEYVLPARDERGRILDDYVQTKRPAVVKPKPLILPIVRLNDGDKGTFFSSSSWQQLGLTESIISALAELDIRRPSYVQAAALEAFMSPDTQQHMVLADQAGSGKTLAYLLPLIQALKTEEAANGGPVTQPGRPRIVIVAPTVELVQQVTRVCKALSKAGARFKSSAMTGGQPSELERSKCFRTQRELLKDGVDVVITTPGRLMELIREEDPSGGRKRAMSLDGCRALVMDEVDVLLGGESSGDLSSFAEQMAPLKEAAPPGLRFVLVSATLAQHVFGELRQSFPDMTPVFGPGLHRTANGLTEELLDCSGGEEVSLESGTNRKLEALGAAMVRHQSRRILVFCNKIDSCREVENFLKRQDPGQAKYRVLAFHEAIRPQVRQQALEALLIPPEEDEPPLVLVCTDRTSRGIDSVYCDHVVLFDFPRDPSEYVRRVGRTARGAGGFGVVSVLVLGRQVALAQEIMTRNEKGMPVHRIPPTV